jgi:hypothetical protein
MIRTQVQLRENQYETLKEISRTSGESIAALIRRAVDQLLLVRGPDRKALYRGAHSVVGKYTASESDISVEHDRYLDEAYGGTS